MNWDAIGAVAEGLGAAGVVVTLLYLSAQIRSNTRQMRSQAFVSLSEAESRLLQELRGDPDLLELLLKGNGDWHSLSAKEQCRYLLWNIDEAQLVETAFVLWTERAISDTLYLEREKYYLSLLKMPGRRHWWENYTYNIDSRFKARIDERLAGAQTIDYGDFLEQFPMYRRENPAGESCDPGGQEVEAVGEKHRENDPGRAPPS